MERFQLTLIQRDYAFLRREAQRQRISMAAVMRAMIEDRIRARSRIPRDHPFRDIIGIGHGDGSAASEKHDQHLYGCRGRKR